MLLLVSISILFLDESGEIHRLPIVAILPPRPGKVNAVM